MKPLVVDCSVSLAVLLGEEHSVAEPAMNQATNTGGVVPEIWWYEVLNGLLVGERQGRITSDDAVGLLADAHSLHIEMDDDRDDSATLELARRYGLTAYDAAYLEVAVRRDLPLATLDRKLAAAAQKSGVPLYGEVEGGAAPS